MKKKQRNCNQIKNLLTDKDKMKIKIVIDDTTEFIKDLDDLDICTMDWNLQHSTADTNSKLGLSLLSDEIHYDHSDQPSDLPVESEATRLHENKTVVSYTKATPEESM